MARTPASPSKAVPGKDRLKPRATKASKPKQLEPRDSYRGLKEETLIDRIGSGDTLTAIAEDVGTSRYALDQWVESDAARSARVRVARSKAAAAWDDKAEQEIRKAKDPFEASKARELAHHYRWRASKIAPKVYGDKLELAGELGIRDARELSEAELVAIATGKKVQAAEPI